MIHSDAYLFKLRMTDTDDVAGCPVLGLGWDPGDHSMRHRGERLRGQVHPATLEPREGETVLRWTIPPYVPQEDAHEGT